ncbi:MAG: restriction endonuclease subunit S [Prevotella sp.]|nr:restriction endonuclease subunit S [Prevotella sp.]
MKYIDELLQGAEVEWKPLGEVCVIKTGKGVTKKDAKLEGVYPIISGGKTPMDYIDIYNRQANTVTVSRVGANAGFVNYIVENFYLNDKCFSVIPKESYSIISRFLYYALKKQECKISALQSEGGVPTINTSKLGSILIPLPPLPIQEEIVRILDKFTTLEAELEAELDCRKRQYEYYRNQLLSFDMLNRGGKG